MSVLQQLLSTTSISANPDITLRDYRHASKIFSPNNNSFAPKTKNWFHVYFQLNSGALTTINQSLSTAITSNRINWQPNNLPILGVLAKTVVLPQLKFEIVKKNQYNKWSINTTKTNYESVQITLWDDTINTIDHFLYAYYQYMNADSSYVNWDQTQTQGINIPTQWAQSNGNVSSIYSSTFDNYGLDTVQTSDTGTQITPVAGSNFNRPNLFFDSIRIYQFNRSVDVSIGPEYNEFVLVNPVITSYEHDQLDSADSDFMTNKMTIDYETVLYNSGQLENDELASWDRVTSSLFDNTVSPLGETSSVSTTSTDTTNVIENATDETTNIINSGGVNSVTTVLDSVSGSSSSIDSAAQISSGSSIIGVPTILQDFGTSGNPPTVG